MNSMPQARPGDWNCPACGNLNYSSRDVCNIKACSHPRPADAGVATVVRMSMGTAGHRGDPKNWWCPLCKNENFPTRTHCNRKECNCPRPFDPNGNWACPQCGNDNYPQRMQCNNKQCGAPRPQVQGHAQMGQGIPMQPMQPMQQMQQMQQPMQQMQQPMQQPMQTVAMQPIQQILQPIDQHSQHAQVQGGNWICSLCNNNNYPHRMQCNNKTCNAPRPGNFPQQQMIMQQQRPMQQQPMTMGFSSPYGYSPVMQQQPMMQTNRNGQPMMMRQGGMVASMGVPTMPRGGAVSRPGDWLCPACNNHNYASRDICNNQGCGQRKVDSMRWVCPSCHNDNFPERDVCNLKHCQTPKPDNPDLVNDRSEIQGRKRSKPGDPDNWICDACGNENFPSRAVCNLPTCREPRGVDGGEKRQRLIA